MSTAPIKTPWIFLIVDSALAVLASFSPYLKPTGGTTPFFGFATVEMSPGLLAMFTGDRYAMAHNGLATALLNAILVALSGAIMLLYVPDRWSLRARRVAVLMWGVLYALLVGVLFRGAYVI
ncbi:MAG: hypothetical protein ACREND_17185 [Gemmatimonadaceae bacterium]